ncbi:MAG: DUF4416 family protein [candidate division WOR-3 bacterium]
MKRPTRPESASPCAILVIGLLAREETTLAQAEGLLTGAFGPVAERSQIIPFDFTDYYEPELGKNLLRSWLGFSRLVPADQLAEIKVSTIRLEQQLSVPASSQLADQYSIHHVRTVNLDPGILTLHNFVLASTKDFAHRIYLGSGISAEVTLIFHQGRYEPLPWTYPDYKTDTCQRLLLALRTRLKPGAAEREARE